MLLQDNEYYYQSDFTGLLDYINRALMTSYSFRTIAAEDIQGIQERVATCEWVKQSTV